MHDYLKIARHTGVSKDVTVRSECIKDHKFILLASGTRHLELFFVL